VQVGCYEIIGRQVTARFSITLSGWTGSPSGIVSVALGSPLPAAANVANDNGQCFFSGYTVTGLEASNIGIKGQILPNTSAAILLQDSNTASSTVTAAQFGAKGLLSGYCNYHS
jgi:hypothetical protein